MFGNLLNVAASVIPQQTVQWTRWVSREQDARGRWVDTYAEPVDVTGSFQAVEARTAKEMGFDTDKKYASLHTSHDMRDAQRGTAPDRITYGGETYDLVGDNDWFAQDGWKQLYMVRVTPL